MMVEVESVASDDLDFADAEDIMLGLPPANDSEPQANLIPNPLAKLR
jgi:hypothetical protein